MVSSRYLEEKANKNNAVLAIDYEKNIFTIRGVKYPIEQINSSHPVINLLSRSEAFTAGEERRSYLYRKSNGTT